MFKRISIAPNKKGAPKPTRYISAIQLIIFFLFDAVYTIKYSKWIPYQFPSARYHMSGWLWRGNLTIFLFMFFLIFVFSFTHFNVIIDIDIILFLSKISLFTVFHHFPRDLITCFLTTNSPA